MNRPRLTASGLPYAALCPGKPNAEEGLADQETPESRQGTKLHRYFCTSLDRSSLTDDERELLKTADELAQRFIAQFKESVGLTDADVAVETHEQQLYGPVPGKPDYVLSWRNGKFVAILDLKSGMGDVDEAPSSLQLAAYALLRSQVDTFDACGVAIIQPDALGARLTTARYTWEMMRSVADAITHIHSRTLEDDAPRIPGESQCRWCKAKTICPQYKSVFMEIEPAKINALATVENDELERLKLGVQFAEKINDDVNAELRRRIEAGDMPGWKLKNTGSTRVVNDPVGMFVELTEWLGPYGFTASDYEDTRETKWGDLERLVRKLRPEMTEKVAKLALKDACAPYVTETEKAKAPVKVKQ